MNKISIKIFSVIIGSISLFQSINAEILIRDFKGSQSITTSEFDVSSPWLIDWRVNSNYKENMALEVSLVDAKTGFLVGRIFKTKYAGNGVKIFNDGGRYRLRISSSFTNWNFKIKEITISEAESYSVKAR
ncbi:MAG: hypothetical protein P8O19_05910 [Woeseiaceae bacterium]|jgi:hypothetical protein|nr:hypothetical protein [Woeseiaceae bacterium]MDG1016380.1 hypothetical protein [Woeseiaceae bacterium]MDG1713756.1 hypothetical protein [Woeseiaceae bacterium]MDG1864492.1 hypothetical protein [Woeseiaceae bacterium]|tara:strand:+ start:83 stop:475 length:393 start_codon:yes stop_codon:yes gene_type:complete